MFGGFSVFFSHDGISEPQPHVDIVLGASYNCGWLHQRRGVAIKYLRDHIMPKVKYLRHKCSILFELRLWRLWKRRWGCHKVPARAALLITRRGRPQKPEQRRLSPRHHPISPSPVSAQTVLSKSKSKDTKCKMKLSSALGFALVLAIILVILTPEVNICLRKEFASGKKSEWQQFKPPITLLLVHIVFNWNQMSKKAWRLLIQ